MFFVSTYFYFLSDCKGNLSSLVCVQESQFVINVPVFRKRNIHKCLCNKFFPVLVLGILFSSLNKGRNCKISLGILMQVIANSKLKFKCNLICLLNLYIDIGIRYIPNMKTCSVYHQNQNRNKAENKCSSLQQRYLSICLFDYKVFFVSKKDRKCLRTTIPAYCFIIFGSNFGALPDPRPWPEDRNE